MGVLVAACLGVTACQLLVELDADRRASVPDASAPDAQPFDDEADAEPACRRAWPPPPPRSNLPSIPPILFAASYWDFEKGASDVLCPVPGYDFDGLVTGPGGSCPDDRSCQQRPDQGFLAGNPCDFDHGADNGLNRLLQSIRIAPGGANAVDSFKPPLLLATGLVNLLIDLQEYNGSADDDDVVLAFYGAAGYQTAGPGSTILPDLKDAGIQAPSLQDIATLPKVWDGRQDFAWVVDRRTVKSQPGATDVFVPTQSVRGYVKDFVLVVTHLGKGIFPIGLPGSTGIAYVDGNLKAALRPQASGTFLLTHGRLSARYESRGFLTAAGGARNPDSNVSGQLCEPGNQDIYRDLYKPVFCSHLDLPKLGAGNDPSVPCEELSATILFASVPSRLATREKGYLTVGPSLIGTATPCVDAGAPGTEWCDDCAWGEPRRCPTE